MKFLIDQGGRGGGGMVSPRESVLNPPASMTSRLASVTFKMANKVFIEEMDENFEFITAMLFRFLGSRDFDTILE